MNGGFFKKNWLLIIILVLGIFVRLTDYNEPGYWGDDSGTIPSAVLWFYPHTIWPGFLDSGKPPLGHMIIGLSCISSGEDFSGSTQVKPQFYPGTEILIGNAMINSEFQCRFPMYLFGILFLIVIAILAILLLGKYSAVYAISIFAFFPEILKYSRFIHEDIIFWFFIVLSILFLYLFYKSEKSSKKELAYLLLNFIFLGLSLAVKFSAGMFLPFTIFLIIEKYRKEFLSFIKRIFLKNYNEKLPNEKRLISVIIIGLIIFSIVVLIPFNFKPSLITQTYKLFNSVYFDRSELGFNALFYKPISTFLFEINFIDKIIFFFSFFILFKLLTRKKTINEKFILYLVLLFYITLLIFNALNDIHITIPYLIGPVFLMALSFSDKEYSLFNILKIKKKLILPIFMLIYIIFSFSIAAADSPYFLDKDPVSCFFLKQKCEENKLRIGTFTQKQLANYLSGILNEDETFVGYEGIIFYYIRQNQGLQNYIFDQSFIRQVGREPTLEEKVMYFHPDNRTIRYVITPPSNSITSTNDILKNDFKPNYIPKINNKEVVWIFDLQNLTRK